MIPAPATAVAEQGGGSCGDPVVVPFTQEQSLSAVTCNTLLDVGQLTSTRAADTFVRHSDRGVAACCCSLVISNRGKSSFMSCRATECHWRASRRRVNPCPGTNISNSPSGWSPQHADCLTNQRCSCDLVVIVMRQMRRQAASKACAAVAEVKKSRVVDADEVNQYSKVLACTNSPDS